MNGKGSNYYIKTLATEIGNRVKLAARNRGKGWYTPFMAAASRAIAERIPLVDFVVEVRDARIPMSSECQLLSNDMPSSRRIIVMNKMDLANRSQLKDWVKYFDQRNYISCVLNSHNKDSVKLFLNFLQAQIRALKNIDHSSHTVTIMLVGTPNVGKSALANSLHQIGRISAAEKGKLKHAIVSPHPGETKDISSLKIGSHPNIYVLDTPSILPPQIREAEVCTKLALTGAIEDCLVGEKELAQLFLAILNLSDEYKKWTNLLLHEYDKSFANHKTECSSDRQLDTKEKKQYVTDHTQDFIVNDARRVLFEKISCFNGDKQNEVDLEKLIRLQFTALAEAFRLPPELGDDADSKVAAKLLNLYRTGRLGHYTLDPLDM
ncbi:DAR GTPase 2, mitochondrial isoform X2 [Jatropha curcas]|uniref:DAR GTPase 2, mitochondrial isoform X2 n=1 Tax=Jatropha curcas TaxID=180498 RepID=UPI0005FC11DB|nr:DAR GTPase 2, mitochondrial isoform X2 [Jatropha curcas]